MNVIKGFAIIFMLIFLYYRSGILLKKIIKSDKSDILSNIIYGFIMFHALFELIAIPFNLFKIKIKILFYVMLLLMITIILSSYLFKRKEKHSIEIYSYIKSFKQLKLIDKFLLIFAVLVILFQIFNSAYLHRSDADDAYYVSWAQEVYNFENYFSNDISSGREISNSAPNYIFNSWEIFYGFTARIVKISVPALAHTFLPALLILISYIAYYKLFCKITNNKKSFIMLLFFSIIMLFSAFSNRSRGIFFLGRIYQGKSIVINIILPIIVYNIISNKKINFKDVVLLILTNIASISFNPISLWIIPIQYFLFGCYYLFTKNKNNIFKLILIIIPNLIFVIMFFIINKISNNTFNNIELTLLPYKVSFYSYLQSGSYHLYLYIFSIIVILLFGNKETRMFFIWCTLFLFLTFTNPLLSNYVQIYVANPPVYWRLFWLIPNEIAISYAFYILYLKFEKNIGKYLIILTFVGLTVLSGKYVYGDAGEFKNHSNMEKVDSYVLKHVNYLNKVNKQKINLIAPKIHGFYVRQLSSNINLFYSRDLYEGNLTSDEIEIYNEIYINQNSDGIQRLLDNYNIDYLIIEKENLINKNKITKKLNEVYTDDTYIIYKLK